MIRTTDTPRKLSAFVSLSILAILGFATVAAVVTWTSSRSNEAAVREQRQRLESAVDGLLQTHADAVTQLAHDIRLARAARQALPSELARARLSLETTDLSGALQLFVVENGQAIAGLLGYESVDTASYARLRPLIETLEADKAAADALRGSLPAEGAARTPPARLMFDGERLLALANAEIGATGQKLVGALEIGPKTIALLAWRAGTPMLDLVQAPPRSGSNLAAWEIGPPAREGKSAGAYFVWTPLRPGDLTLIETLPLILVLTALFGAWLVLHFRRVNGEITASAERALHLAGHDPLTDLPNRMLFDELLSADLAAARDNREPVAVFCLDLRRFKEINDNFGHAAGDALLLATRDRLSAFLGESDVLARMGGNEFALMRRGADRLGCEALAQRLVSAIREPFTVGDLRIVSGVAIGVAMDEDAATAAELLRCADVALFHAKTDNAGYVFYRREMSDDVKAKKRLELDLRHALSTGGLHVNYQPIMASDGRTVVGAEALVRWNHPTLGMVPPLEFVGLAEDRGLIDLLGEWVLRRACVDARSWPANLYVAVNVSPVQFRQAHFLKTVERVLSDTGFDAGRLELELTESAVVADEAKAEDVIMDLRAQGIRMALDDFGTGYSSLIYLRRFAFDKIKIDRSFLEAMETTGESAIIVHSIVHLGRSLGLTVTAEGIETPEQHRFLQALGCHELQGYFFARPLMPDAFLKLVAASSEPPALAAAG
ncbi:MAG: bifunctional diguanylate cyclase/phosphodiesterase [Rhizobiales bacterium]|nr:bifunctional diguanylate cyclase/phosphodiesterase [Hyphomicrobiales bacterium]